EGVARTRDLHAGFVVPRGFVLVGLVAAEDGFVGRRAERQVQRIVDAAETEALARLNVQGDSGRQLVAGDDARRDAVRRGFILAVVAVGKEAAGDEPAGFVKLVIARAGRHRETIGDVVARF